MLFVFAFHNCVGKRYFARLPNYEMPCALKAMSLFSAKQSDIDNECIQEEPVSDAEKGQVPPSCMHQIDADVIRLFFVFCFFFLLLRCTDCLEMRPSKTSHLVIMPQSQLKFEKLFSWPVKYNSVYIDANGDKFWSPQPITQVT